MALTQQDIPVILSVHAHDPSGCGGIQADIEACASLGAHCVSVISAVFIKDTSALNAVRATHSSLLIQQVRQLLEDMPVNAIKIGYLGTVANIEAIHSILMDYPQIPVILQAESVPKQQMTGGVSEALDYRFIDAIKTLLLPHALVFSADLNEVHAFAPTADGLHAASADILETGCQHLLVNGSEFTPNEFVSHFYSSRGLQRCFRFPRLRVKSFGCGSTLAASIAAYTGHGLRLNDCIERAQQYTWESMESSRRLGMGLKTPNRFHWIEKQPRSMSESKHASGLS